MTHRRNVQLFLLLSPATLFLGVFFLMPLGIIAVYSLLTPGLYGGVEWTFYHWNYGRIFGWADGMMELFDPVYLRILGRSLLLAAFTVFVCLVVCYPVAFWIAGLPQRWRMIFLFLIALPFFASLIVRLYAWLLILKPSGFLGTALAALGFAGASVDILYTPAAVVLGMVYIYIPFMFLPLFASVDNLDRALIDASADLGAKPWQTFLKVTLPMTLPGIAGGSVIVFIPAAGNFIVPDVLGGARGLMTGNLIEQQFLSSRNWPFGSALAMVVMAVVFIVLATFAARTRKAGGAG
ncbi:ABC transporter permease [Rhizobiaceae bacterium BDR2-2]|uniref:ABC transporter permease n=1 Tax=Ectorhizobium quercum TaxID=2965071 RepID=A0AAE3MXS3_9HYPH|nr:ABC transporter permease [Ectorhizobium quercum]MCX8996973.1 ABC transporter permease [Ectorhizobium quercum]